MGTGSFPEVKSALGVALTLHPLLVPWSWKSRAIPLFPLWAARPVQSLSACTRVTFTFFKVCYDISFQDIVLGGGGGGGGGRSFFFFQVRPSAMLF